MVELKLGIFGEVWVWKPRSAIIIGSFGIFGLSGLECWEIIDDFFEKFSSGKKLLIETAAGAVKWAVRKKHKNECRDMSMLSAVFGNFVESKLRKMKKIEKLLLWYFSASTLTLLVEFLIEEVKPIVNEKIELEHRIYLKFWKKFELEISQRKEQSRIIFDRKVLFKYKTADWDPDEKNELTSLGENEFRHLAKSKLFAFLACMEYETRYSSIDVSEFFFEFMFLRNRNTKEIDNKKPKKFQCCFNLEPFYKQGKTLFFRILGKFSVCKTAL